MSRGFRQLGFLAGICSLLSLVGCGSSPAPSSSNLVTNGQDGRCETEKQDLLAAFTANASCAQDADCVSYVAPCVANGVNCSDSFYVNQKAMGALDSLQASFDACLQPAPGQCGPCDLLVREPACVQGTCVAQPKP